MKERGRLPLVVGNWKMNLTELWAVALLGDLLPRLREEESDVEVAVAPAFPCLRAVADRLKGERTMLAAQNLHWEEKGPFTGEVSPRMLAEMGVRWVIVGHSERRIHFGDTDERIRRKMAAARHHGIAPILCVGEQEADRDEGRTLRVVERQLRLGLADVRLENGPEVAVAYEPVWAIGTGRNASPGQIQEVHRMVREQLAAMYGAGPASLVRILYGGSVTPENAQGLLEQEEVDGALVGGASLDANHFSAIVRQAR